ncbi:MAG: lysylphosphatidylglycerol synthase domain-containing protein [bacterium]
MLNRIKKHKRFIQGTISFSILAILISKIELKQTLVILNNPRLLWIVPWLIFYYVVTFFLFGSSLYCLFRRMGKGAFARIVNIPYKLEVLATFIPGRLGDIGLVHFLKDKFTPGQSLSVLVVDKVITLSIVTIISAMGIGAIVSWYFAIIIILGIISGWYLILRLAGQKGLKIREWVIRKILGKYAPHLQGFHNEIHNTVKNGWGISGNVMLTLFRFFLASLSLTLILSVFFGIKVNIFYVIFVQTISQLAAMIPVTLMGIGLVETVGVSMFMRVGIQPEIILTTCLLTRTIHLCFIFIIFLWQMNKFRGSIKGK